MGEAVMSPQWQSDDHYNVRDLSTARRNRMPEEPTDDVTSEAIWLAAIVLAIGTGCALIGVVQVVLWGADFYRWAVGA